MNTDRKVGTLMLVEVYKQSDVSCTCPIGLTKWNNELVFLESTTKVSADRTFYQYNGKKGLSELSSKFRHFDPIIICDDEIGDDNYVYSPGYYSPGISGDEKSFGGLTIPKFIGLVKKYGNAPLRVVGTTASVLYDIRPEYGFKKILVQSHRFSPEFLQAIVDGKVKSGDKVNVLMEIVSHCKNKTSPIICPDATHNSNIHCLNCVQEQTGIKLRKDGTAIIHPYKESPEEAARKYSKTKVDGNKNHLMNPNNKDLSDFAIEDFLAGVEWQKNQ